MTGHLQKKGNIWYAVVDILGNDGIRQKQKWISTKQKSKTEANKVFRDILNKMENESYVDNSNICFLEYAKTWLEDVHKIQVEPTTYEATKIIYTAHFERYFKKNILLQNVTALVIQKYFNEKAENGKKNGTGLSGNTLRKHKILFKSVFDYAVKNGLLAKNPVDNIVLPKKQKFIGSYYTADQLDTLIQVSKGSPVEAAIFLTAHYGFRRGEVLGLTWDDIDFKRRTITVNTTIVNCGNKDIRKCPKTESSRRVLPFIDVVEKYLRRLKVKQKENKLLWGNSYCENNAVCCWDDGRLQSTNYISHKFADILKEHNLPRIRFHDLRHSTASYLLKLGFSLKEIQVWLGHSDISTTANIYSHVDMEMKQNVANKLNKIASSE